MTATAQTYNRGLYWFAVLTAIATFLLLGAGGLVTSHEAGMSVPDWPNTYGYNMFLFPVSKWIGGIFYEHTHRLIASAVGLLTTILVLWLFGKNSRPFMRWAGFILPVIGIASELLFPTRWLDGVLYGATGIAAYIASFFWPRCEWSVKWLRGLGVATFLLVVAQGVLGGLRVVLTDAQLGIFHGVLAQSFFVLTCALALFTSRGWLEQQRWSSRFSVSGDAGSLKAGLQPRGLRWLVLATTVLIFGQLILGATMRHQHAGLAIPDFPAAYGSWWPDTNPTAVQHYNAQRVELISENPITAGQIILQMAHRIVALAIFILVAACAWQSWRRLGGKSPMTKLAVSWLGLIIGQILLGAWTIWSNKAADVATAHVLVGALALVTGALWCVMAYARPVPGAPASCRRETVPDAWPTGREAGAPGVFGAATATATNK